MAKLSKNLKESNRILKEMNVSAVEFQSTVNAIQEGLKKVAKEEQSVGDLIDIAKKNNRKLKTAADALAKIKKEELKTEKGKQKFLRAQAKFQGLQNKNAAVQEAIQKRIVNATDSEAISLAKISKAQKDIEESAEETAKNFKEINNIPLTKREIELFKNKDLDFSKVPEDLQDAMFYTDKLMKPNFAVNDLVKGKISHNDAWYKYHYAGSDKSKINLLNERVALRNK